MSSPGKSLWRCAGASALSLLLASCAQLQRSERVERIPIPPRDAEAEPPVIKSFTVSESSAAEERSTRAVAEPESASEGTGQPRANTPENVKPTELSPALTGEVVVEASPLDSGASPEPADTLARFDLHGSLVLAKAAENLELEGPLVVTVEPVDPAAWEDQTIEAEPRAIARRVAEGFHPGFLVVTAGREVRFENEDSICHSFFSSSEPNSFELGIQNPGEAIDMDLQEPGLVQVYCSLHAGKQLSLLVVVADRHAVVDADGGFVVEDLPSGEYLLEAWSKGRSLQRMRVKLSAEMPEPVQLHIHQDPTQVAE